MHLFVWLFLFLYPPMMMKHLKYLYLILPFLFNSCSCEREEGVDNNPNKPGWVAKQFYTAFADQAYFEAMEYCDNSSKRKLENDYFFLYNIPPINFIKVDSCDEYEDHAYCYCRYANEDSSENTDKLLLRNFNDIWKVHYDPVDSVNESRLYSKKAILNELAPDYLFPIIEIEKTNLDTIISRVVTILNNPDFIVGFFPKDDIEKVSSEARKESSYDDYYILRSVLDMINVSYTFNFGDGVVLDEFKVVIMDFDSDNKLGEFQYLIEELIKEYGTPYNAEDIPLEEMYKYNEIKWFLQGYNEELIISSEYQNITLSLVQAY